ncbi:unnamed protein product [Candidula unifasciata]|uniref:Uncharacterized protein n=1 Tax=Candidula unifasciata TaxID=100452 RepID=A0A8S3ZIT9_9EUPU|nr:unnamed protein product [Candidula unifasciata]
MAFSTNMSVAESSVYRAIYDVGEQPLQLVGPGVAQPWAPDTLGDSTQRWTFLQKLLAIEKAHDCRRIEREKQTLKEQPQVKKSKRSDLTAEPSIPDLQPRWLHGQVLEESPGEPAGSDACCRTVSYLPSLDTGNQTSTYASHSGTPVGKHAHQTLNNDLTAWPNTDNDPSMPAGDLTTPVSLRLSRQDSSVHDLRSRRKRQLRLPPILLPRVYTVNPRPLQCREFLTPTTIRGPITDEEWEDLKNCRYIRQAVPRFCLQLDPSNLSSFEY